uniref:Uncharacterized protein n=1 Tax=Rhizophora mucronata TaxID=61149 RepID=A0A2P2N5E4_RHIMU
MAYIRVSISRSRHRIFPPEPPPFTQNINPFQCGRLLSYKGRT